MKLIDNSSLSYLWTKIKNLVSSSVSNKKNTQSAVSDPSASGTSLTFISEISQNAQGVISPSKKTVSTMTGASSSTDGASGLVPKPVLGDQEKFLKADGTWDIPIDTNTWRGIQDNLTSDSSTDSLSAKQGKVLKTLVDSKAAGDHNHDNRYVKLDDFVPVTYIDELPYDFNNGSAVVLNNEIHILVSNKHYKWNGLSWASVSTLPYEFNSGAATVYNGEIHIFGGIDNAKKHYKWNGNSWVSVSTLPNDLIDGGAAVYNNNLYIGIDYYVFVFDGVNWTRAFETIERMNPDGLISYNNKLHAFGIGGSGWMEWDGNRWDDNGPVPYLGLYNSMVVYNDEIHTLGGDSDSKRHYKWKSGINWTSVSTLPYNFVNGSAVVYNNEIHILGGQAGLKNHYRWTGTEWTNIFDKYALINHNHDDRYYTKEEIDEDFGGNTFVGTTAEWNALTTEQQNAYNCRVITDDELPTVDVIDNLNSDSSTDALSAKQGKVLKGLIDSMSESDYYRRYANDWGGNSINFIDNTSGKIMFTLAGVLTLKDDILTFDGAMLGTTNDYKGGRILNYTADLSSTFTELSNYEWDTGWIADNSIVRDDGACMGWCTIFNEECNTPIDYVSGNGLKVRITHIMGFDEKGYIKPDFLHFSAKVKPRTTQSQVTE